MVPPEKEHRLRGMLYKLVNDAQLFETTLLTNSPARKKNTVCFKRETMNLTAKNLDLVLATFRISRAKNLIYNLLSDRSFFPQIYNTGPKMRNLLVFPFLEKPHVSNLWELYKSSLLSVLAHTITYTVP